MPLFGKFLIKVTVIALPVLLLTVIVAAAERSISERSLAADTIIKEAFQAGSGLPVGKIQSVRGETFIFHRDPTTGYRARTGLPLYRGDILHTRKNARLLCRLVDGSRLALASGTVLTLLQANSNSARKSSESFLILRQGFAWFTLNPAPEITTFEFKVETDTAFIQAHKADFIVKAKSGRTEVINLEKSRLEVTNMSDPEEEYFLSDYQRAVIRPESVYPLIETISPTDAEALVSSLRFAPDSNLFTYRTSSSGTEDTTTEIKEE